MKYLIDLLKEYDITGFIIAGVIGYAIVLLYPLLKYLFITKRRPFNISRTTPSSTVCQNLSKDKLKISVSYDGKNFTGSLSVIKIRLKNDGDNDILYSQRCSRPVYILIDKYEVVDIYACCEKEGINPTIQKSRNRYSLKWDLLKRDEFFDICVVVEGEVKNSSFIRFDVRADGIKTIKRPEIRVKQALTPLVIFDIIVFPLILLFGTNEFLFGKVTIKTFLLFFLLFENAAYVVLVLSARIKWLKE
ncbi:MAG: hypothetical protein IKZ50_01440 [Bacteroidales bacterium]|nr:hypothetical protein [Bacteroidales bacterium]